MDVLIATVAALVAGAFALRLWLSHRRRPRLHVLLWAVAMAAYFVATTMLAIGLSFGWSEFGFRIFYLFGAIVNIPLLAAGSVALVFGEDWGLRSAAAVAGFSVAGAVAVFVAPLAAPLEGLEVPAGEELFDFALAAGGLSLPGPRVFAIIAGAVGTVVVVALAGWSAKRWWPENRRRSVANVFIVAGMVGPAFGGSLTALGAGGGLALSLLVGATLLFTGFTMASG